MTGCERRELWSGAVSGGVMGRSLYTRKIH